MDIELTPEALAKEEVQARLKKAGEAINALLQEHRVSLRGGLTYTAYGIIPDVQLVDNPQNPAQGNVEASRGTVEDSISPKPRAEQASSEAVGL